MNTRDQKQCALRQLLCDFGYRLDGETLICNGIKGFLSDSIIGRRRSLQDAVESLIPIVHDDEFTARFKKLGY
jgi:hypothetical protein